MRKPRREIEIFSLSFLDMVSCGFGAVILLLVIVLAAAPSAIRQTMQEIRAEAAGKDASRARLVAESQELTRALAAKQKSLAALEAHVTALRDNWERGQKAHAGAKAKAEAHEQIEQRLRAVQQTLSDEMKRLLSQPDRRPPGEAATIGGLPVDSEYIIFVIDTSGSMKQGAWPLVVRKVEEILSVHPQVKGIQILSDNGNYMFPTYRGQWIPDTPARRAVVIQNLRTWNSFSTSNPTQGILSAIRTFRRSGQRTSIYVFGDDFNGESIDQVVTTVAAMNGKNAAGQSDVRIHTMGFPVLIVLANERRNFIRYAHLMRTLAEQNSGSFVGINSVR